MEKATKISPSISQEMSSAKKGVIVDSHADIGLKYLVENGTVDFLPEEECGVRWKIDLHFLPIVSPCRPFRPSFHMELTAPS